MNNDEIINQRHSRLLGKEHWFHKDNVKEMLNQARQSERAKIVEMLENKVSELQEEYTKKITQDYKTYLYGLIETLKQQIQKIKEMP